MKLNQRNQLKSFAARKYEAYYFLPEGNSRI